MTDELVSVEEAHQLLRIAKKGLAKGGGAGGASILGTEHIVTNQCYGSVPF